MNHLQNTINNLCLETDRHHDISNMASEAGCNVYENDQSSDPINEKKMRVPERIQRRQQERFEELKKKQEERQSRSAKNETVDYFTATFGAEKAAIETRIENISSAGISKAELIAIFDELAVSVQKLQKFATDSGLFLSSYDIRHTQDEVSKLQSLIDEKRDDLMPKKKFAFKARKKASSQNQTNNNTTGTSTNGNASLKLAPNGKDGCIDEADSKVADGSNTKSTENSKPSLLEQYQNNLSNVSDKTDENITLGADEINGKDVAFNNLTSCTIQLCGSPSAIHMDRITNCKIFCGPVPGSVFLDNCVNSTLVLSCQQLRVHHTKDTMFYLHVTSRGIIEDTTEVQFAPYNWTYPGIEQDYEKTELNQDRNNWDDIDDFNWLASDKRSPNWSLLPENERVKTWETNNI